MARRRRSLGDDLPALELETWSEPAPAGVAADRPGLGRGAWAALLIGLAALSGLVFAGRSDPPGEALTPSATERAPSVGVVAEPQQFVARTATLMPPGHARRVPLPGRELLSRVGTVAVPDGVELSLGRYSEWMRGTVTIDHLVWVLVEKSTLTSRVRIFDAVDGEALVEFSGPPGLATCPIEIGASVDHCASVLAASHRLVLSYLTSPHQY
jgi:hypothetical protein